MDVPVLAGGCTETVAVTEAPLYWALIVAL
jgi:hypothetical protein